MHAWLHWMHERAKCCLKLCRPDYRGVDWKGARPVPSGFSRINAYARQAFRRRQAFMTHATWPHEVVRASRMPSYRCAHAYVRQALTQAARSYLRAQLNTAHSWSPGPGPQCLVHSLLLFRRLGCRFIHLLAPHTGACSWTGVRACCLATTFDSFLCVAMEQAQCLCLLVVL